MFFSTFLFKRGGGGTQKNTIIENGKKNISNSSATLVLQPRNMSEGDYKL